MPRREPGRTCIACRTRRAKAEFVRVVRTPSGGVSLDPTGHMPGRGAYICADATCLDEALKRSALQRSLRTPLPNELRNRLEQGDIAALRDVATRQAPPATQGGTHGA